MFFLMSACVCVCVHVLRRNFIVPVSQYEYMSLSTDSSIVKIIIIPLSELSEHNQKICKFSTHSHAQSLTPGGALNICKFNEFY